MAAANSEQAPMDSLASPSDAPIYQILALYKFVAPKLPQKELKSLQQEIEAKCRDAHARGCILVACEGINGTICYPQEKENLLEYFLAKFPGLRHRISYDSRPVFTRLKIKIKPEIVTLSCDIDPTQQVGTYIPPGPGWNTLLQNPDCLVIDTRNDYEVRLGTFQNAVNPRTHNFKEFPEWLAEQAETNKPKSIAMFCTGGIRCEKATSLALASEVFQDTPIYHLEGGILAYLDQVPEQESQFEGECYVFDQRVAVTHGLLPTTKYTQCHACRNPLLWEDLQRDDYEEGMSCRYCINDITDKKRKRFSDRQKQIELSEKLGTPHLYDPKETQTAYSKQL